LTGRLSAHCFELEKLGNGRKTAFMVSGHKGKGKTTSRKNMKTCGLKSNFAGNEAKMVAGHGQRWGGVKTS